MYASFLKICGLPQAGFRKLNLLSGAFPKASDLEGFYELFSFRKAFSPEKEV